MKESISSEALEKLCDDHWAYVEGVIRNEYLSNLAITDSMIDLDAYCERVKFHYKTAMAHGFKHGIQWLEQQIKEGRLDNVD